MVVSTISQPSVTTSAQGVVYSSNPGVLGSGSVNTTTVVKALVSTPTGGVQQYVLATFLQSGLISFTGQMVYLIMKLDALSMRGLSVPLPLFHVQTVPLFKTVGNLIMWELNSWVKFLLQAPVATG